jgi:hypothetical protein
VKRIEGLFNPREDRQPTGSKKMKIHKRKVWMVTSLAVRVDKRSLEVCFVSRRPRLLCKSFIGSHSVLDGSLVRHLDHRFEITPKMLPLELEIGPRDDFCMSFFNPTL